MSPTLILLWVAIGIVLLFLIGYLNVVMENLRLQKARRKADLLDRIQRCQEVVDGLPEPYLPSALKHLMLRQELLLGKRLQTLGKAPEKLARRLAQLPELIDTLEKAPPLQATTDAPATEQQVKALVSQLENLYLQIGKAASEGLIEPREKELWQTQVSRQAVILHLEYFIRLGQQFLQQKQPQQAHRIIERGLHYLGKQKAAQPYDEQRDNLLGLRDKARQMLQAQHNEQQGETLTQELAAIEEEENPIKRNLYDD